MAGGASGQPKNSDQDTSQFPYLNVIASTASRHVGVTEETTQCVVGYTCGVLTVMTG